jgi:hypothetical protein
MPAVICITFVMLAPMDENEQPGEWSNALYPVMLAEINRGNA